MSPEAPSMINNIAPPAPVNTRSRWVIRLVVVMLVLAMLAGLGIGWWVVYQALTNKQSSNNADNVTFQTLNQSGVKLNSPGVHAQQLTVSDQLKIDNQVILTPTSRPTHPVVGQIYLDSGDSTLYLYDGTTFKPLGGASVAAASLQGQSVTTTTSASTGVLPFQSSDGSLSFVSFVGGISFGNSGDSLVINLPQNIKVSSTPTFGGLNLNGPLSMANTAILSRQSNSAVLLGDGTGDSRGLDAVDLQGVRGSPSQVAVGNYSVAVGNFNTAGTAGGANGNIGVAVGYQNNATGADQLGNPNYGVAFGIANSSTGWDSISMGLFSSASNVFGLAIGVDTHVTGWESTAVGRYDFATNSLTSAYGYQSQATGFESTAVGGRAIAAGTYSQAFGGNQEPGNTTHAFGNDSTAVGVGIKAEGNGSSGFGAFDLVGYPERVFTISAGGTSVTIPGGDYSAEYSNGDTVLITMNQDYANLINTQVTISGLAYNSGPNTTTFTISAPIDGTTTGGRVVDQDKGQRSGAFGYNNTVNASDAYVLGEGITNNLQGSVQIGSSNTNKLTVDSNGRLGIAAAPANGLLTVGTNTTTASGGMYFGTDTDLYRTGAGQLATDSELITTGASSTSAHLTVGTLGSVGQVDVISSASGVLQATSFVGTAALFQGGVGSPTVVTKDIVGQTGDLLQAQSSSGTILASIDHLGNLTVKNAIINGHIISGGTALTGSNIAAGSCGAGCTVSITGDDIAGLITINTGTGTSAGSLATVTFANAYTSGTAPLITITPVTVPASSNFPQYYYSATNTSFSLRSYNALTDSQTYTFSYHVIQ